MVNSVIHVASVHKFNCKRESGTIETASEKALRSVYAGDFYRAAQCNFCRVEVPTCFQNIDVH